MRVRVARVGCDSPARNEWGGGRMNKTLIP